MSEAVARAGAPPAPRERGWRGFVLALAAMLAVTAIDTWPPSLALPALLVRWALPVEELLLLVLAGLAANAVGAWRRGGAFLGALAWSALAIAVTLAAPLPEDAYGAAVRGWTFLLGGAFGAAGLLLSERPFLTRALVALAMATVVGAAGLGLRSAAVGAGPRAGARAIVAGFDAELARRRQASLDRFRARLEDPAWIALTRRAPSLGAQAERVAATVEQLAPPVFLVPGLLALESLAALALAWAAWHRLARTRVGPPLAPLTAFRFSDQLVWGLVVGAGLVLPPVPAPWRAAGVGLLLLFGTLHVLRGVGVLVWWLPERWAVVVPLVLLGGLAVVGPTWVLAAALLLTLGLGLGDTWRDLRRATPDGA